MKEIQVNFDFSVGTGFAYHNTTYKIDVSNASRSEAGIERMKPFLNFAFNNEFNRHLMVTIDVFNDKGNAVLGYRFIHEEWNNGYEKRTLNTDPYDNTAYPEQPMLTFGTEGDSLKEMRKDFNKTLKQILKQIQTENTKEVA